MTENELIAEFMGLQVYETHEQMQAVPIDDLKEWAYIKQLQYDKQWNWIMPVVEKIFMLRNTKMRMSVGSLEISSLPYVNGGLYFSISVCESGLTGLQCYHKAVVEFIKWYNEQPK